MCGRFTQKRSVNEYASIFGALPSKIDWSPRYNLSPGQLALAVRMTDPGSKPEIATLLWGFIPHWSKEKGKYSTINARIETVDTKPSYRYSFRNKRAIIPLDGYLEWAKVGASKRPWYFHRPDDKPLALAGLWDTWTDPEGQEIESFTIVVRPAIEGVDRIHDRMPAILPEEMWREWLDPSSSDLDRMKERLMLGSPGPLDWYQVSTRVNSSRNEGEDLILRVAKA